jgi:hypothetical protein
LDLPLAQVPSALCLELQALLEIAQQFGNAAHRDLCTGLMREPVDYQPALLVNVVLEIPAAH